MASKNKPTTIVFPVVMAGGSGTRFWPLSRKLKPKQFLALTTRRTMIEETVARCGSAQEAFVVCGAVHAPSVRKLLKTMPKQNVLVEPQARNTAPAIALATAHVALKSPDAVLVVLPSDQHVANVPGFKQAVDEAVRVAQTGRIVTLGIKPTRPETGYGYIRLGGPIDGNARQVAAFVEKPDVATAQQYLQSGEYLWNAGIFIFRADTMLKAFEKLMPELYQALQKIQAVIGTKKYESVLKKEFARMPATSIDYGVAEKADNIAVVPADCGWSDVGSFNALSEVRTADANGNVVEGDALVIDSSDCVVLAQAGKKKPVVAVVGMKDTVVVDAGDAILVLPRHKSQDVRKVVEALKAAKRESLL